MTRMIVIGNSHVAALKVAWDQMAADHPGIEMDFFAAPGRYFHKFELHEGLRFGLPADYDPDAVVLDVSGREAIDLSWADHVVWAGYYWPMDDLANLMIAFDIDGLREVGAQQSLSQSAFEMACAGIAEDFTPGPEWRNWTRPRLVVLPAPMRSADCLRSRSGRFRGYRALSPRGGRRRRTVQRFRKLASRVLRKIGVDLKDPRRTLGGGREVIGGFMDVFAQTLRANGIDMVPQPAETLLPVGLTDTRFTRGSRRIIDAAGARDDDLTHMNAAFGKLHLSHVLDTLAPAEAPPAHLVA